MRQNLVAQFLERHFLQQFGERKDIAHAQGASELSTVGFGIKSDARALRGQLQQAHPFNFIIQRQAEVFSVRGQVPRNFAIWSKQALGAAFGHQVYLVQNLLTHVQPGLRG